MVFTAHRPHAKENRKTWFGYWKRDTFLKTKKGRIDVYGTWACTRERWVEAFRNREIHAGESIMQKVGPDDEWCAEAYMETDYSVINHAAYKETVRSFVVNRLIGAQPIVQEGVDE